MFCLPPKKSPNLTLSSLVYSWRKISVLLACRVPLKLPAVNQGIERPAAVSVSLRPHYKF